MIIFAKLVNNSFMLNRRVIKRRVILFKEFKLKIMKRYKISSYAFFIEYIP